MPAALLRLVVEFGGGMELLFASVRTQTIHIPRTYTPAAILPSAAPLSSTASLPTTGDKKADIRFLIWWLRNFLLEDKARGDLFSQAETIRPGILILINSTDWELEGELEYELVEGDEVVFISTLHGG